MLLKLINIFILQWFFIRLTKCNEILIYEYEVHSYDLMIDGNISSRGTGKSKLTYWYSLQYWVVPFTGYFSDFIYLNKKVKFIKITSPKIASN